MTNEYLASKRQSTKSEVRSTKKFFGFLFRSSYFALRTLSFEPPLSWCAARTGFLRLVLAALLLASLLFAHGCHGDEDHELFGWLRSSVCAARGER